MPTDDEQMTILQYIESVETGRGETHEETLMHIDAYIHIVLHIVGAPRIYELHRDADGRSTLMWSMRSRAEWEALTRNIALSQMFGGFSQ